MRTAFIQQLIQEAEGNERIFLLVGDLGYSVVEPFAEKFPNRFLNVGIAEQNMTGVAAGLAKEGYNVFTYSIGNFPTLRAMEQIRYDLCYHNLSVKVVAVGAGYAYGALGTSHHTTEDIGMLRTIPKLTVCSPSDPVEARSLTSWLCNNNGAAYLRLGKAGEAILHTANDVINCQTILPVKSGIHTAILSTGSITAYASEVLEKTTSKAALFSVPVIKPLDIDSLQQIAQQFSVIITLEEHQRSGGFGSAILEALHDLLEDKRINSIPFVKRIAIPDMFFSFAGTQNFLRESAGLLL